MCSKNQKFCKEKEKGDDTMSAAVKNYAYRVIVKGKKETPIPAISNEKMQALRQKLGKYLKNK